VKETYTEQFYCMPYTEFQKYVTQNITIGLSKDTSKNFGKNEGSSCNCPISVVILKFACINILSEKPVTKPKYELETFKI
jgi:hypothetical protein